MHPFKPPPRPFATRTTVVFTGSLLRSLTPSFAPSPLPPLHHSPSLSRPPPPPYPKQADVKAGQDAFKASLDLVVQENLKCAKGMQAYGLGMACFACKADAVKYVDSTKEVVKLAQNTCNSVFATCGGVFSSYTNLVKQTIALVNRIVAQFSIKFDLNWDTDLCKGVGCQDYVCNTLLNGVASQLPQVQMPTKRRLDVTVDGDVRAEHVPLVESVMAHLASLEAAIAATADAAKGSHQRPTHRALAAATNEALAAENLNQVAPASVVSRVLATSSHSSYQSSGGYDPYAVGCKDIECPDISGTTTIIVVVAAVAVVALIVLVTMFAVRRRKGSAAGSPAGSEVVV